MTIAVCIGIEREDEERQWDYLLAGFKPDELYVFGESRSYEISSKTVGRAIRVATAAELPDYPLIVLSSQQGRYIKGKTSLLDFKHPTDATYMFGSDFRNLSEDDFGGREPDDIVYIPTDEVYEMYSWTVAAIVFWDRRHG